MAVVAFGSLADARPSHRRVETVEPGRTLRATLEDLGAFPAGADFAEPTIVVVDGTPALRDSWSLVVVDAHAVVNVWALPQGGGRGGKNPLAMVLMLAAAVVIPALGIGAGAAGAAGLTAASTAGHSAILTAAGGVMTAAGGLTTAGTMLAGAINAGLVMGAAYAINTFLGPSLPKQRDASPTYSLTARGNRARLGQPIPVQYGRVLRYPEFASAPYSEFSYTPGEDDRGEQFTGEQTLYLLFCLGWGEFDVEEYRLLETDIEQLGEVTVEKYDPGTPVTLFPTAVVTSESVTSIDLEAPDKDRNEEEESLYNVVNYSGTITDRTTATGGSGTITDSTATWTTNELAGKLVTFTREVTVEWTPLPSGTVETATVDRTFFATILSNTATTITYSAPTDSHLHGVAARADIGGDYTVQTPQNWEGPYQVTSGNEPQVNAIGLDMVFPTGLNHRGNTDGELYKYGVGVRVEYRATDSAGTPLTTSAGLWRPLGDYDGGEPAEGEVVWRPAQSRRFLGNGNSIPVLSESLQRWGNVGGKWKPLADSKIIGPQDAMDTTWAFYDDTERPLRESRRYSVAPGYYQVRVRRVTGLNKGGTNTQQALTWTGLRGYGYDANNVWEGKTIIAVRLKSSQNVNAETVQDFGVLCTRKLRDYLGGGNWSAVRATRRISSALIDMVENEDYGLGQTLSEDALEELWALEQTWQGRDAESETPVLDLFDGVFDTAQAFWDAANAVARAGRARTLWPYGELTVVRDEARSAPTAAFNATNITRGSFSVDYSFPTPYSPDYVIVEYFDGEKWRDDEVVCSEMDPEAEGYPGTVPARIQLFGVTQRQQAWREGMYELGLLKRRRVRIQLSTDAEGHLPFFGDLVEVSHDLPDWGQSGRIIGYAPGSPTSTLTTSEPLAWTEGSTHVMQLKNRFGVPDQDVGLLTVTRGAADNQAVFTGALSDEIDIHTADQFLREATHYSFGVLEQNRKQCLVEGVVPRGTQGVDLFLSNYVESGVYDNDDDANYIAPTQAELLDRPNAAPTVTGVLAAIYATGGAPSCRVVWQPTAWAKYYIVEASLDGGSTWKRVAKTDGSSAEFPVQSFDRGRDFQAYNEAVLSASVQASVATGKAVTVLVRDETGTPDPWEVDAFAGMALEFTSGIYSGEAFDIATNGEASIGIEGNMQPLPEAADTFHVVAYRAPLLTVGVRAVNRLMGTRATATVSLEDALGLARTAEATRSGELDLYRGPGLDGQGYRRQAVARIDAAGNLVLAGSVVSSESNADLTYWTVADLRLAANGTDAYLPAFPAADDFGRVLVFCDGQLLRKVASSPGVGEWESGSGTAIALGFDATGSRLWCLMLADGASSDLDEMQLGVACTFDVGVSTTAFALPATPVDDEEVVVFHNGSALVQVASSPGAGEFSLSGTSGTLGHSLSAGDHLAAVFVSSGASAVCRRLRVEFFTGSTLPRPTLHPRALVLLTAGQAIARTDYDPDPGEFRLSGSPPRAIQWGHTAGASDVHCAIHLEA